MPGQQLLRAVNRTKGVVEDVVCYLFSLPYTRSLVEVPMDAEINPALTIFFFRLR